jgi:hypothetical protein
MGGLFEAVDPGVVAAGESVEGFFEADLLFAGGFFEETRDKRGAGGTNSDRSQSASWVWATSLARWVAKDGLDFDEAGVAGYTALSVVCSTPIFSRGNGDHDRGVRSVSLPRRLPRHFVSQVIDFMRSGLS